MCDAGVEGVAASGSKLLCQAPQGMAAGVHLLHLQSGGPACKEVVGGQIRRYVDQDSG